MSSSNTSSKWWAVFLAVVTVEVILLIKLLTTQATIELLLTIGVVTIIIVLTLRINDLIGLSLRKDGLEAKLNSIKEEVKEEVKGKVKELGDEINDLLISTIIDAFEYITLKKITGSESSDNYQFNYPKGQDLLERLRNRGLIDEIGSSSIFDDRRDRAINVREHFKITDRGKRYLDILAQRGLTKELEEIAIRSGYRR